MNETIKVVVQLFGEVRALAARDAIEVQVPTTASRATAASVLAIVSERLLAAARQAGAGEAQRMADVLSASILAVRNEFVDPSSGADVLVASGDDVALIPPLSGG